MRKARMSCLTATEIDAKPLWRTLIGALVAESRAVQIPGPLPLWVATERRLQFESPVRESALTAIVQSRLEGLGPVTVTALAATLPQVGRSDLEAALLHLQSQGVVMRGRFSHGCEEDEWCERRLLARIHRYTVRSLRAEIEPVAARD